MTQRRMETGNRAPQQRINEMIRVPQVRVISDEGEQLGIMSTGEALHAARAAGLDLVEVASDAKPPVCRIMDYSKFKYQQKKRLGKQQTHQSKLKELRLRPKTGEHDLQVKIKQAKDFLTHKDKVLISVMFKGRELAHIEEGEKMMTQIVTELEPVGKLESPPKHQGKRITCTLCPK
ncbi:MAG: translation initiation factor IF-3 [Thermoguttaceae bacterium]